jgi:PrtD family type I secretion system ABC transporter
MKEFLARCRFYFLYGGIFSFFLNVLQLTFPIYMLQIYDKVLSSYSEPTLIAITLGAVIALITQGLLQWTRSRLLVRFGVALDEALSGTVLHRSLKRAVEPELAGQRQNAASLRDTNTMRNYLAGSAMFIFFDIPWIPIYMLVVFFLHPVFGGISIIGAVIIMLLGYLTDKTTRKQIEVANAINQQAMNLVGSATRNAFVVHSMGMVGAVSKRWSKINSIVVQIQTKASTISGLLQAITQTFRVGMQVATYAAGAYLVINHEATAGAMIAASIIMGRALAPIEQGMASYRQTVDAWSSYKRLKNTLDAPTPPPNMSLPVPKGFLSVDNVHFAVKGQPILNGVTFALNPGETLAVIGPSAAGKSTLCRLLLGIWPPNAGRVNLDGANVYTWDQEELGQYLGYLPQDVELFSGSVAENIARLGEANPDQVVAAAKQAGVHELILRLPKGYDTQIGEQGTILSGGQRQRIGLARALYGQPRLVILDEPNSNLDEEGERALMTSMQYLKFRQATLVVVSHKLNILTAVDKILLMQNGRSVVFGPRDAVLQHLTNAKRQEEELRSKQQAAQDKAQQSDPQDSTPQQDDSNKTQA